MAPKIFLAGMGGGTSFLAEGGATVAGAGAADSVVALAGVAGARGGASLAADGAAIAAAALAAAPVQGNCVLSFAHAIACGAPHTAAIEPIKTKRMRI